MKILLLVVLVLTACDPKFTDSAEMRECLEWQLNGFKKYPRQLENLREDGLSAEDIEKLLRSECERILKSDEYKTAKELERRLGR